MLKIKLVRAKGTINCINIIGLNLGPKKDKDFFQNHPPSLHSFGILREKPRWIAHIKIAHTWRVRSQRANRSKAGCGSAFSND